MRKLTLRHVNTVGARNEHKNPREIESNESGVTGLLTQYLRTKSALLLAMENFRRQFLLEAAETLTELDGKLQNRKTLTDSLKFEIFRTLHTIKGTAQTFGFNDSSRLAHELENLISAGDFSGNVLREGINLLIQSLTEKDFEFPEQFVEKICRPAQIDASVSNASDDSASPIPDEIFSQLSTREKKTLSSALLDGKNLFCLKINFELINFADELINVREILSKSGEIIATLPGAEFNTDGKIGFRILTAGAVDSALTENFDAAIIFQMTDDFFGDVSGVLEQVVRHGKTIAETLDKQIEFKVRAEQANLAPSKLKLVFGVLLHLVRNAVDHAIKDDGEIKIDFLTAENHFKLIVSDNGRGLEFEKILQKAIEKKLISTDAILTEKQTVDLIFLPEFSTKTGVTEISGRGIGLDAVKCAVEQFGGRINTKSRVGKGTTFEIYLPH